MLFIEEKSSKTMCKYYDHINRCKCTHESLLDSDYCIFHLQDDNKDINKFNEGINELLQTEKDLINFNGFYFPLKTDIFLNKKFLKKVVFVDTVFPGKADFMDASFLEDAVFWNAKFFGKANFLGAKFSKKADFLEANFFGEADFTEASFKDSDFSGAEFSKEADFLGANFFGEAGFSNTSFITTSFSGATFCVDADFSGASFLEKALFREAKFRTASFWRASFRTASFSDASFLEEADFLEAKFIEKVEFSNTKFTVKSNFTRAKFLREADFTEAKFFGKTDFIESKFFGITTFLLAIFSEKADFSVASFSKITYFWDAIFSKEADFSGASFFGETDFLRTSFSGEVLFKNTKINNAFNFTPVKSTIISFIGTYFSDYVRIKANLSQSSFYNSNIDKVDLTDSIWIENEKTNKVLLSLLNFFKNIFVQSGIIILEERHGELSSNWKKLEGIYRRLKQSYQKCGDNSTASEFYYCEMECKRKQMNFFQKHFWNIIYKGLCGYGEKPFNVIFYSLVIVIGFAILYFYNGVLFVELNSYKIINYTLRFDSFDFFSVINDFLLCLYTSIITFTTLGYCDLHLIGWSRLFASIESVLGIFMTALFIFAFSRKMLR